MHLSLLGHGWKWVLREQIMVLALHAPKKKKKKKKEADLQSAHPNVLVPDASCTAVIMHTYIGD